MREIAKAIRASCFVRKKSGRSRQERLTNAGICNQIQGSRFLQNQKKTRCSETTLLTDTAAKSNLAVWATIGAVAVVVPA